MDAIVVYALLNKKLKGVVSGIKNITTKPDGTGIIFELNNGSKITLNIPNHVHTNLKDVLEKLTVDTNGDLFFDGIKVIRDKDVEFHVVNSYSKLTTPTIDTVCYVLNDETVSSILYEKGFYVFSKSTSTWKYIKNSSFELNPWKPNNLYKIDEYAYINYKLYKSLKAHTSTTDFDNDLSLGNWELIIGGGTEEIDPWKSNKAYSIGDKVLENGDIYQCIKAHTSNIFADELDNWVRVNKEYVYCTIDQYQYLITNGLIENKLYVVDGVDGEELISEWKPNTKYNVGDKIIYQNKIYECIVSHTSTTDFDNNKDAFIEIMDNNHYYCNKSQFEYMKANNLLKDKLYIVEGI